MVIGVAEQNFFPLKEKGKGGEYRKWRDMFEQEMQNVKMAMFSLRDEFGSQYFTADGRRLILEVTQAGTAAGFTYPQIRWVFYSQRSTKRNNVVVPIVQALSKSQKKTEQLIFDIRDLKLTPHYDKFVQTEKQRVELNARSKVMQKSILCINEVITGQQVEKFLTGLLEDNSNQLNLF